MNKEQAEDAFEIWEVSDMQKAHELFQKHEISTLLLIDWKEVTCGVMDGYEIRYDITTRTQKHMLCEKSVHKAYGELNDSPVDPHIIGEEEGLGYTTGRLFASSREEAYKIIEIVKDLLYTDSNYVLMGETLK